MTMGAPTDVLFGACHVVAKVPALGLAVCLGVATPGATNVFFDSTEPKLTHECRVDGSEYYMIDIENREDQFNVGNCLDKDEILPLSITELRARCDAIKNDHAVCDKLPPEW